jgi:hypothetical protein
MVCLQKNGPLCKVSGFALPVTIRQVDFVSKLEKGVLKQKIDTVWKLHLVLGSTTPKVLATRRVEQSLTKHLLVLVLATAPQPKRFNLLTTTF